MTTDIFRLDSQTRKCKVTGLRRVFTHVCTEATAIYRTLCANCGGEHLVRLPIVHASRLPFIRDHPSSTLCDECMSSIKTVRSQGSHQMAARLPPKGHPADSACGEDLK